MIDKKQCRDSKGRGCRKSLPKTDEYFGSYKKTCDDGRRVKHFYNLCIECKKILDAQRTRNANRKVRQNKDATHYAGYESEIEKERVADNEILESKYCIGYYSLTYLKLIKEFCNVTSNKDRIAFSLRSHDPLCVAMVFKKLDNAISNFQKRKRPNLKTILNLLTMKTTKINYTFIFFYI